MDVIQLHGNESPEQVPVGMRVWKAFRVTPEWDCRDVIAVQREAFLLDGPTPGSGEAFDWTRAYGAAQYHPCGRTWAR